MRENLCKLQCEHSNPAMVFCNDISKISKPHNRAIFAKQPVLANTPKTTTKMLFSTAAHFMEGNIAGGEKFFPENWRIL